MTLKFPDKKICIFIVYFIFCISVIFMLITLITTGDYKKICKDLMLNTTISKYRGGFLYTDYYKPVIPEYLIAPALPTTLISVNNLGFINFDNYLNYNYYIEEDEIEKKPNNKGIGTIKNVTIIPKSDEGYLKYGNTFLIDQSTKAPNISEIMKQPLNLAFKSKENGPQILLYHTHNSESFNESGSTTYNIGDSFRSNDNTKNVIAVGDALQKGLEEKNIAVSHTITKNELEEFNKSYSKSEQTVNSYLKKFPSINMTIDIHRDSVINDDGDSYRPVVDINTKKAAQIMIIVGTGSKELPNEHWQENIRTAITLQQKIESKYPSLCRPILIRDARYNMHATNGSLLIEIGTEANTLEEVTYSGKLLSNALSELINERVS